MAAATVDSTKFGFADDSTPTTPVDPAPAKRLITNYDEALKIYRAFVIKEKAEARKQLIASGATSDPAAATPAPGATSSNALRSEAPAPGASVPRSSALCFEFSDSFFSSCFLFLVCVCVFSSWVSLVSVTLGQDSCARAAGVADRLPAVLHLRPPLFSWP
jgi:hypothetical protein